MLATKAYRSGRYRALGPLGKALVPLFPGRGLPVVASLACYFDDSFDGRIYVVGGYIGTVDVFDEILAPRWNEMLQSAALPITEFKTSDCRQLQGEFRQWDREDANELTRKAIDIITECPKDDLYGIAGAVVFPSGMPNDAIQTAIQDYAFRLCVHAVLYDSSTMANLAMDEGDEIQVVFDRKAKFHEMMQSQFDHVVRLLPQDRRGMFGAPLPRDSDKLPALQAADIIAHETYKEIKTRLFEPERRVSVALRRLVESIHHHAVCIEADRFEETIRRQSLGLRPDYREADLYRTGQEWRGSEQWMP